MSDKFPAALGGVSRVAELLQLPYQTVAAWKRRGIPPERVIAVENATGVSRHEIRPDIYPPPAAPDHARASTEAA
jgi:DNA-binding transcriptional regulator YdaS (Cro superfamily)